MPRLTTYRLNEILDVGARNILTISRFETATAHRILEDVQILVDRFQMYVFNTKPMSRQYKVVNK